MRQAAMTPAELIESAEKLVPLFREKARESELARRAPDDVIDAVRESGLYAMMVPTQLKLGEQILRLLKSCYVQVQIRILL